MAACLDRIICDTVKLGVAGQSGDPSMSLAAIPQAKEVAVNAVALSSDAFLALIKAGEDLVRLLITQGDPTKKEGLRNPDAQRKTPPASVCAFEGEDMTLSELASAAWALNGVLSRLEREVNHAKLELEHPSEACVEGLPNMSSIHSGGGRRGRVGSLRNARALTAFARQQEGEVVSHEAVVEEREKAAHHRADPDEEPGISA